MQILHVQYSVKLQLVMLLMAAGTSSAVAAVYIDIEMK